jgi:hypothetical protein
MAGSLRWYYPDRFRGYDLSRQTRRHPSRGPNVSPRTPSCKSFLGGARRCRAAVRFRDRRRIAARQPWASTRSVNFLASEGC